MKKYGITEKKKAELDLLSRQVLEAQLEVQVLQATVNSLTSKSAMLQQWLADADAKKTQALNNKNQLDSVVNTIHGLRNTSFVAFDKMVDADAQLKETAIHMKVVMDKLIYSVELLNKLAVLATRKKAQNPLISDDIIDRLNTAGKDANNAVALALVALKSTFTAQASSMEAEAITALEFTNAITLHETITGDVETDIDSKLPVNSDDLEKPKGNSLKKMIYQAYHDTSIDYEEAKEANSVGLTQLNYAIAELTAAQIMASSLESELAAANAAALAS